MRSRSSTLALACALAAFAAMGAQSQSRPSLADRVAAIEARDQGQGQQNIDLLNRITQLESDVKQLRALVEQVQNDNQQAGERAKAQYIDLDSRLGRLEGAGQQAPVQPPPAAAKTPAAAAKAPPPRPAQAAPGTQPSAATQLATAAPASGAGGDAAYKAAFDAMKAEHYADSAKQFNDFVQQHPDSALAPNAYYWMGESYYVTQNYQYALQAFQTVVERYPESSKAAGAMLKVGYCQDGLKQRDAAKATLRQVIAKYPSSDEAAQAQGRLRALSMDAGG